MPRCSSGSTSPLKAALLSLGAILASFGVLISDVNAQEGAKGGTSDSAGECQQRYDKIQRVLDPGRGVVPKDFRTITKERAREIAEEVQRLQSDCERFLVECKTSKKRADVEYFLARSLFLLSRRWADQQRAGLPKGRDFPREKYARMMAIYYGRVARHAGNAFDNLPKDSHLRPEALQLRGWGTARAGRHDEAVKWYQLFLKSYPSHSEASAVTAALGGVYLDMKSCDAGIELLGKAVRDPKSYYGRSYPITCNLLWKLYVAKGDLQGMLDWSNMILLQYPLRLKSRSLGLERENYERILDFAGFRKGFSLLALGEFDKAREAFQAHIRALNQKEASLQEMDPPRQLKPESAIYRKRSEVCLQFVDERVGRPAPMDFQLGEFWVSPQKVTIADARNKAVAVVFRGVGDIRSAGFIEGLDNFCAEHADVELLTLCYLRPTNVDSQLDPLRAELSKLDYESAAGFDPDAKRKRIFRAYGANVGSATVVILDRNGQPVWFQQDPRDLHVNMNRAILRRLVGK